MCAIFANGSYDCDEMWVIYVYDTPDVFKYCYPGVKVFHYFITGCATWDDKRGHSMILSNNPISHTGDSTFLHEIKHLICLCNFHASPPESPRR